MKTSRKEQKISCVETPINRIAAIRIREFDASRGSTNQPRTLDTTTTAHPSHVRSIAYCTQSYIVMPTAIPTSPSSPPPIRKRVVSAKHKRISTGGGGDESSSASPLQPSRQANITPTNPTSQLGKMNDDVAEKASRRKSAHFGDLGEGRPGENGRPGKRVVSALAVQAQQQQQQQHGLVAGAGGASMASRRTKRLSAVAPVAPVNLELDKSNFEEWMKLATDNVGQIVEAPILIV